VRVDGKEQGVESLEWPNDTRGWSEGRSVGWDLHGEEALFRDIFGNFKLKCGVLCICLRKTTCGQETGPMVA